MAFGATLRAAGFRAARVVFVPFAFVFVLARAGEDFFADSAATFGLAAALTGAALTGAVALALALAVTLAFAFGAAFLAGALALILDKKSPLILPLDSNQLIGARYFSRCPAENVSNILSRVLNRKATFIMACLVLNRLEVGSLEKDITSSVSSSYVIGRLTASKRPMMIFSQIDFRPGRCLDFLRVFTGAAEASARGAEEDVEPLILMSMDGEDPPN